MYVCVIHVFIYKTTNANTCIALVKGNFYFIQAKSFRTDMLDKQHVTYYRDLRNVFQRIYAGGT